MSVQKSRLKPRVMSVTTILFIVMLGLIMYDMKKFYYVLNNLVMNFLMTNVGWAVSFVMLFCVVLCVVIMVTPMGKIKLGGPNAQPKFSYMQWFGISLCTGIGAGVVFWGAAEPLLFAMEPAPSMGCASGSNGAVIWSMLHCFLQWGFTPYASCVIMGVILSYAILNMHAPFKASSCLVPMFGRKVVDSGWCDVFDAISAFALTGAVAGGLGYGAMQLSAGVKAFAGIKPDAEGAVADEEFLLARLPYGQRHEQRTIGQRDGCWRFAVGQFENLPSIFDDGSVLDEFRHGRLPFGGPAYYGRGRRRRVS